MKTIELICDSSRFRPCATGAVRWLDWGHDYDLAQHFWPPESIGFVRRLEAGAPG